jgi:hypothetical protein
MKKFVSSGRLATPSHNWLTSTDFYNLHFVLRWNGEYNSPSEFFFGKRPQRFSRYYGAAREVSGRESRYPQTGLANVRFVLENHYDSFTLPAQPREAIPRCTFRL